MNKFSKFLICFICYNLCIAGVQAQLTSDVPLGIDEMSNFVNVNRDKQNINDDLIKFITLDGFSKNQDSLKNVSLNITPYAKYFISGDKKFSQANITSAYSDYLESVICAKNNDFYSMLLAYKLANIGFFTLSQQALNQIFDKDLYIRQINSLKHVFFSEVALSYDEEIYLAELYADIYYNNLSKESAKELGKNISLLKKSDYANYVMAQAYYESAEYSKALQYINKALDIKIDSPIYLQYKAKILCDMGDYKQSLKIIDNLLLVDNIYKFQHSLKMQREFVLSNFYKNESKSKLHLAKYFYLLGEYNRALKEVNNSISLDKRNHEAYVLLGNINYLLGDYNKAKDTYNKSLELSKKNALAYIGLANIEKDVSLELALDFYKSAYKYDKNNSLILTEIAYLLNKIGNTDEANSIFDRLLANDYTSSNLYYVMSKVYKEKQVEYLRKSLEVDVFNVDAWIDLAEVNIKDGNISEAEKNLIPVSSINSENFKYYYVFGLIEKARNNVSIAAALFKQALKMNPNYLPAQLELNTLNL